MATIEDAVTKAALVTASIPQIMAISGTIESMENNFPTGQLNLKETEILRVAQQANPHMFKAVLEALSLMAVRRQKYSGDHHSYFNFADMSRRTGLSLSSVFRFYLNLKMSRLSVSDDDFSDERMVDTLLDIINYAAIAAGAEIDQLTVEGILAEDEEEEEDHTDHTVVLDLDGVLNKFAGWTGQYEQYEIADGALEFVKGLTRRGWLVVICTARADEDLLNVYEWAEANGLLPFVHRITNVKTPAAHYIDDKALRFNGNYEVILNHVETSKPHWDRR